jgi:hypothetical protein
MAMQLQAIRSEESVTEAEVVSNVYAARTADTGPPQGAVPEQAPLLGEVSFAW